MPLPLLGVDRGGGIVVFVGRERAGRLAPAAAVPADDAKSVVLPNCFDVRTLDHQRVASIPQRGHSAVTTRSGTHSMNLWRPENPQFSQT